MRIPQVTVLERTALYSEHQLQVALCKYLSVAAAPELHWFAIPNGERRSIGVAVRLKKQGVRRGSPDLCIMLENGRVAWLELKIKGGQLSPDQKLFRDKARSLGHAWGMAKTMDEAIDFLASVGALRKGTY